MSTLKNVYDPDQAGTLFYPHTAAIAAAAKEAGLPPAALDDPTVQLLLIDMQVDFCHEQGSLYVPGAVDDIRRVVDFIDRHAAGISHIVATLDSHLPFQIFHPPWWVDADGRHPDPLTIITRDQIEAGEWRPVVMPDFSQRYVEELEAKAKKQLTIWPYHVLIGGPGNMLDPALWTAVMWHSLARQAQPTWLQKGRVPQSEHYSAVQPEIDVPGHPQGQKQTGFLDTIRDADYLVVAGEAESHCVLATLTDIVNEFADEPQHLDKIYVLQDCMSPVQHPDVDFHALAQEQFDKFAEQGVHFVNSTDDLPFLDAVRHEPDPSAPAVNHLHTMAEWGESNE